MSDILPVPDSPPVELQDSITLSPPPLAMYIILRKDLTKLPGWSTGSIVNQACHATAKNIHVYGQHPAMKEYLSDVDSMTKVTLGVKNESQLSALATLMEEKRIDFVKWYEQPENMLTCLATRPYRKVELADLFKQGNASLYRG